MTKKTALPGVLALLALPTLAAPAVGESIRVGDIPDATSTATAANGHWTAEAIGGGDFIHRTLAGVAGIGVSGGAQQNEIDGDEGIAFNFNQGVHVSSIDLAFLFEAGNHGDSVDETARFDVLFADGARTATFSLSASGVLTGFSDGLRLETLSAPVEGDAGRFRLSSEGGDLFGGAILGIVFHVDEGGDSHSMSDYGFVGLDYALASSAVPMPSAALLACAGFGAAGMRRRRD